MKRIIATSFIIILLAGCIAGLILLNSKVNITQNVSNRTFDLPELKMADSKLLTTVIRTDVEKWIEMDGVITGSIDEMTSIVLIKKVADITALAVTIGDRVEKEDILYEYGNKKYVSPVNGRIADIIKQGSNLKLTIINYDCLYIAAQIPQIYIDEAVIGKHVDVEYNGEWIDGTISFVDYQVSPDKTIYVKISYVDTQMEIRPGSFVKIKIIEKVVEDVVAIPLNALIKGTNDIYYVQLIDDSGDEYNETVSVQVGLVGNKLAEVLSGLNSGDRVLVQEDNFNFEAESSDSGV